ncbi:SNAP25 homologous protein SNAP33-like [Magnolia sinica]|uniref:SNAP25 homologous protein SNAP33-like n=1 Tax=Magnolia sinica TaxID=86752 RepID=UPI002659DCCE|nr:SNAP25 homologous protein SNAP33-like [Magnolia sinica]
MTQSFVPAHTSKTVMTKTPVGKNPKQQSVESGSSASSNPFDSNSDSDIHQTSKPGRASSAPITSKANSKTTPSTYTNDEESGGASSASVSLAAKNRYKNGFLDSGGSENQTVQELENYAVYKAEETTKAVNGCLKIAEEIREDATNTLITLHQKGEQITRTHMTAANIDHDLNII